MKRVESALISQFLDSVRKRGITADDQWKPGQEPGPNAEALELISAALARILRGADPRKALWIQRSRGAPADPFKELLEIEIRDCLLNGYTFAAIEKHLETWLPAHGRDPIKEAGIKKIDRDYRAKIAPLTPQEAAEIDAAWSPSPRRS